MKRRPCSTWVFLVGLLVASGCDSKNCPSGDAELPFPYEPTVDACVRAAARKTECEAEVRRALEEPPAEHPAVAAGEPLPADTKPPPTKLHAYHLIAQCECFPERRSKIEECLAQSDCGGFARCFVDLSHDGWAP